MNQKQPVRRKHILMLATVAAGMFGFAFAMVPLYEVFCEITGLNGKTGGPVEAVQSTTAIQDRQVTVQFLGQVNRGLPWEFRPTEYSLKVRPGEIHTTSYYVRNRSDYAVTGQATPSVSPGRAAGYLKKIECFCFTQQELKAGEAMQMPVRFMVTGELPEDVKTLSLSYTFFKVRDPAMVQLTAREDGGA